MGRQGYDSDDHRDAMEQGRLEEAIRARHEVERQFRRFADTVSAAISRYNLEEGRYDFVSSAFARITGYSPESMMADPDGFAEKLIHPEDLRMVLEAAARSWESSGTGEPLVLEYRIICRDGSIRWVEDSLDAERDADGRLVGINSVLRDVHDRKVAEERFERFASAVTDVIYRYDVKEGRMEFISPSCEAQTGYTPAEMMADPTLISQEAAFPGDLDRGIQEAQDHIAQGPGAGPLQLEYRVIRKDRRVIWVSESIDYDFDSQGAVTHVNSVVRDISELKRIEEDRERLIQELEVQNRALDRYAYSVAHDLKSPLITINGFLDLLVKDLEAGRSGIVAEHVQRISGAAERMAALLEDLLALSQVDRSPEREPVPLQEVVREAWEQVAGLRTGGEMELEISSDLPTVLGSRILLRQIFQNLLDNAIKYRGDQPDPKIRIALRSNGASPVITLADNGIGIASEHHERVFEAFWRLDRKEEGTGLGLALVRRIAKAHQGAIWVESPGEGGGSTFCLQLPGEGDEDGSER